ncbi:MAG: phosphoglucomutase/phosphomannomutase family protein [Acidobacteria bacterium]|nr:phosphoglucomutase/phosphomannomutase family protein [Acidobacteriota bacterium]
MSAIAFGTSGWRGIIADAFTFPRVRLVAKALADHLKSRGTSRLGICAGYDPRFLSEHFAAEAAKTVAAEGIAVQLATSHVPTPAISHAIRARGLAGSINITASHNPASWSGFKVNNEKGAPSPPEMTKDLEARIAGLLKSPGEAHFATERVPVHHGAAAPAGVDESFREPYLDALAKIVRFDEIRKSRAAVAVDPLWGAGRGFLAEALRRHGVKVVSIHEERDVTFGNLGPDPSPKNLGALAALVARGEASIGIATDGDADRFGVVDSDGSFVTPNTVLALLADYLAESRGWRHGLARTYATTRLIDAVASHYGMPLHQTGVGFKYLGELLLDGKAYLAGEESAGMSVVGHVPEKDGLLAGLLAAEMTAVRGKSLRAQRDDLFAKVGAYHSAREDTPVSADQVTRLRERMSRPPDTVGSRSVSKATVLDGLRLDFDDGAWLLMRPSGTEPVVRYYVEARTPADLARLVEDGKKALLGG